MKKQFRAGFIDIELDDIVEINGQKGELYDIRFIQRVRDGTAEFECRLQDGEWVNAHCVRVIERVDADGS